MQFGHVVLRFRFRSIDQATITDMDRLVQPADIAPRHDPPRSGTTPAAGVVEIGYSVVSSQQRRGSTADGLVPGIWTVWSM
jgi:hypothetical protein